MRYFLFLLGILTSLEGWGQNQIRGRVLDQTTNEPLVGVAITNALRYKFTSDTISISEETQVETSTLSGSTPFGTTTDAQGYFQMSFTPQIKISYLGYTTEFIEIDENNNEFLTIALKPTSLELNQVVVSAYQSQNTLQETPGAISVISELALHRDNDVIIAPALNRVPGVYMHSGAFNTNRITIRGIGSRSLFSTTKIRAYLNDIPLTTGETETSLEDIDLSIIDRVEVIKGPASSQYGAALGGTINLKAKKADYNQSRLKHQSTFGSYGLLRNVTSFRHANGESNINLIYSNTQSDGYRENNDYDRESITFLGQFYPGEKSTITFLANYIDLKAFIPSSLQDSIFRADPRAAAFIWERVRGFEDYERLLTGLSYQQYLVDNLEIRSSIFVNLRNAEELSPFNTLRENNQAYGFRSAFNYTPTFGQVKAKFIGGGEYFREFYSGRTFLADTVRSDHEQLRTYYNIFGQADFELSDQLRLSVGININETQYQLEDLFLRDGQDDTGDSNFDVIISPRIGMSYSFKENIALHASAGHGFSPPGVEETLQADGQVNPDLQPETGWNFEIGSRGSFWNNRLSYDISLYTMRIRNLLVNRQLENGVGFVVNAGETRHNGLELALDYIILNPQNLGGFTLKAFTNYTRADYRFDEFIDEEDDFSGNDLTGTPRNTFNLGIDAITYQGIYGNINFQFIDRTPILDDNSLYSEEYSLLNLKLGYKKTIREKLTFDIFASIQNLTDETYASMLQINAFSRRFFYPGLPRNYFGGFSIEYRW